MHRITRREQFRECVPGIIARFGFIIMAIGLASIVIGDARQRSAWIERGQWSGHVQENPDRQSRGNCLPRHPHRQGDGDQDGRGLFRRRRARAACADGRRERAARAGAGGGELSQGRADHRRVQGDRGRGGASGLWLPVRARELRRGAERGRDRLHRPAGQRHRGDGRQDRIEEARQGGGRVGRPRLPRRDRRHRRGGEDRRRHRLSGDDEGLGRRRRQGHAARL